MTDPFDPNLLLVLKGIHEKKSLREIVETFGGAKSLGTIQAYCRTLEQRGYVENPYLPGQPRKARARKVTTSGLRILESGNVRTSRGVDQ